MNVVQSSMLESVPNTCILKTCSLCSVSRFFFPFYLVVRFVKVEVGGGGVGVTIS